MKKVLLAAIGVVMFALPARAELVFFNTRCTLSVKTHQVEGDSLILTLRNSGEMSCETSLVARFAPDKVPCPEPASAPAPAPAWLAATPAAQYSELIDRLATEQGVPVRLVRAVIQVESAYNERVRSQKGAMVLMQLMPATARQYAVADRTIPRRTSRPESSTSSC